MSLAHDIYSETNPAFCAHALVAFTTAFLSVNAQSELGFWFAAAGSTRTVFDMMGLTV